MNSGGHAGFELTGRLAYELICCRLALLFGDHLKQMDADRKNILWAFRGKTRRKRKGKTLGAREVITVKHARNAKPMTKLSPSDTSRGLSLPRAHLVLMDWVEIVMRVASQGQCLSVRGKRERERSGPV